MRESHKSKRVSWASDVNLCQVRLFLSEDSPSQVGLDSQDHLQAKASWLSHQTGLAGPEDVLPPGFEAAHPPNQSQTILSQIPTIKWKCPPRFVLEFTWQVVAGEESEQAGLQNQREMRVLEAIYPRPSAIPPNPSVLPNTQDTAYDDGRTPSIPITPIEDEDTAADTLSEATAQFDASRSAQSLQHPSGSEKPTAGMALGAEPGLIAAALTGLVNNNEQGNLIDHELLLKILSNPKMVEKLVTDYGTNTTTTATQNSTPISRSPAVSISDQPPTHINQTPPPPPHRIARPYQGHPLCPYRINLLRILIGHNHTPPYPCQHLHQVDPTIPRKMGLQWDIFPIHGSPLPKLCQPLARPLMWQLRLKT